MAQFCLPPTGCLNQSSPMTDWIKCSDELPPNDLHKEILIFNRYKETANGPLFERTFVWLANTFKHNSGCLSLNHFYTWWMPLPEPPHDSFGMKAIRVGDIVTLENGQSFDLSKSIDEHD